jgi:hypothetical protein
VYLENATKAMNERYLFVYRFRQEASIWCYFYNRCYEGACERGQPLSTNGPKNNDKKMKWLVEPIGILALHTMLLEEEREAHKMRFVQSACRARRLSIDNPCRCFLVR